MSRIANPKVRSLSLLSDSEFDEVCPLDDTKVGEAPVVPAFGSLDQPQVVSSEGLNCEESSEAFKMWNEILHQDVQHRNPFREEIRNLYSSFRIEHRLHNLPGELEVLQVELSNLDEVKPVLHLPEFVIETGTVSKQSEAENGVRHGEWNENSSRTQECQLSEEKHNGYGLPACLKKRRVAVTGAGGFIASWIVKLLLQRGFYVRGILRNIADDINTAHLKCLDDANERLELRRADILHLPSLLGVLEGCEGVFHTACPVIPACTDPEVQMLRPAVEGTLNVLRACTQARVQRIVLTSSIGAVYMNPNLPHEKVYDESCWSDENYLRDTKEWYCLAKLMAEKMAWEYAKTHDLNLVSICPGITLGKMLQPRVNQSSTHILKYLNGSAKTFANLSQAYVDVEDAAEAHILAYVTPNASGRYLCSKWSRHRGEVIDALTRMYPHYPIPTRCKEEGQPRKGPLLFCSKKVEQLGLQFTSFEQTLRRAVSSLHDKGVLISQIHDHSQI